MSITREEADKIPGNLNHPPHRGDFEAYEYMDQTRCMNCYNYWNHTCTRCPLCGSSDYAPCIHCDFGLR